MSTYSQTQQKATFVTRYLHCFKLITVGCSHQEHVHIGTRHSLQLFYFMLLPCIFCFSLPLLGHCLLAVSGEICSRSTSFIESRVSRSNSTVYCNVQYHVFSLQRSQNLILFVCSVTVYSKIILWQHHRESHYT